MLQQISVCLTSLYLRGLSRPLTLTRRKWVKVVSALRSADCSLSGAPEALRAAGLWEEAIVLESDGLVETASHLVELGSAFTSVDPNYPARWIERLSQSAPPAVWIRGAIPNLQMIGIVGSRHIDPSIHQFAMGIGAEAVRLGYAIVSGAAAGCDNAGAAGALSAGGHAVEILPHGIDQYSRKDRCGISVCSPDEIFSTAAAMERNALIYAASECTVIAHARFKEGGTWIGAVEATRRHICPLIVRDDGTQASRALIGLGGAPLESPAGLAEAIAGSPAQKGLFGIG